MKLKTKVIVTSLLAVALCVSLISGATFALFTSESSVNIAVTSGKVDVQASVSALYTYSNAVDNVDIADIDEWTAADSPSDGQFAGTFATGGTAEYAVADGAGKLELSNIVPGDAVKFTFAVVNNSNVTVKYQVRLAAGAETSTDASDHNPDAKLSTALEMYFNGETKTGVANAASAWSAPITPAESASLPTQDVVIRLPKDAGDEYQTKSCEISLSVVAIQGNADNASFCNGEHVYDPSTNSCIYCGAENPIKGHLDSSTGNFIVDDMQVEEGATELTVPGTVGGAPVSIADGAFQNNHDLESVTLEEGVVSVGANAFNYCDSITELNLPETLESIGANAFERCESLTEVNLPESLTSIEKRAFAGCIQLKEITIPDSVESIGEEAFQNCFALQSVTLGENITEIGDTTFFGCSALSNVNIEGAVTKIGYQAFSGCRRLTTIELPASLEMIDSSAFYSCGLTSIDFTKCPNLTTIGDFAFSYSAITEITIPDSVTSFGRSVFAHCESLTSATLGTGITSISNSLFYGCTSLTTLTINGTLKSVTGNPFYDCSQPVINIQYNGGTSTEWKALVGSSDIFGGCTANCLITCSDGVTLDKTGANVG